MDRVLRALSGPGDAFGEPPGRYRGPERELLEANNLGDRPKILREALGVVYRARFLVFLGVWKVEFWCPEPFGRMYLAYANSFPKSFPSSLILRKLVPRIILGVFLSRQFFDTFFLNFL